MLNPLTVEQPPMRALTWWEEVGQYRWHECEECGEHGDWELDEHGDGPEITIKCLHCGSTQIIDLREEE